MSTLHAAASLYESMAATYQNIALKAPTIPERVAALERARRCLMRAARFRCIPLDRLPTIVDGVEVPAHVEGWRSCLN